MRITKIPQLYRNAQRWREILAVLSKHGLADWLSNAERGIAGRLFSNKVSEPQGVSREERVRLAMEELGVTFIKLGQVLATRPDQVGVELADELAKLQTAVPADPPEVVEETVARELGSSVTELFDQFDPLAVASGSIGQVHRARLPDGADVAVKVRHPGVDRRVAVDSEILVGLAELAERLPELEPYRPQATAREFQRTLRRELDFRDELRRIEQFRAAFANDPRVRIPKPYPDWSSERVLTIEWIDGVKLSDEAFARQEAGAITAAGNGAPTTDDRERLALHGAEIFLEMIFDHGLYHADPHPGNLLVTPEGAIGLLDFGMVGRLSDTLREELEDVLMAIAADDPEELAAALLRIGDPPATLDRETFSADVADFVDHYGHQDFGRFDLAGALTELFRLVRRHGVSLSPQLGMLLKLLVMLEGTSRRLTPRFSLIELLAPMQRRMMLRRLNPLRKAKKARRLYGEVEQLAEEMPRRVRDLLTQFQSGRFEVHLDHRGLEPSVNRLALGLVTSALIVGGSVMVSRGVWPVAGVSTPGVMALGLAGLLGLRLLWAIRKSGWLDSR